MKNIEENRKANSEEKLTRKRKTKLNQLDALDTIETRTRKKLIDDSFRLPLENPN